MSKEEKYWEFSFDLKMKNLEKFYMKKSKGYAYEEIRRYMYSHGFGMEKMKQGSCYFTDQPISYTKAKRIIQKMFDELPWLPFCVNKNALTEVNIQQYNFDKYIDNLQVSPDFLEKYKEYVVKEQSRQNSERKSKKGKVK